MRDRKQRRAWPAFLSGVAVGAAGVLWALWIAGIPSVLQLRSPGFRKFFSAYRLLTTQYYRPVSPANLLNGAVAGMVSSLRDPFSEYFTPSAASEFQNLLSGTFDGIGVMVEKRGKQLLIVSVNPGSTAQRAGLKAGDRIVRVDGRSVAGLRLDEASRLITGPKGTTVHLTILRPGSRQLLTVSVRRAEIHAPTVAYRVLSGHTGYVRVSVIGADTAQEFQRALAALQQAGAKRLILDLRGNPGGYFDQAVRIAGDLIPRGQPVVITEGRRGMPQTTFSPGPGSALPVVVLVDRDTASAAEIIAAALHDDRAVPLVGTRTYGKGTVQVTQTYPDGSGLKYTVSGWLTPKGSWINGQGLHPTVPVALPWFTSVPDLHPARWPLRPGMNNADVRTLQLTLRALGYAVKRADGYYDSSTARAVSRFQRRVGLPSSGLVDEATADRLEASLDDRIRQSDTQLQAAEREVLRLR
ncbi:MAG: S41 family peptidase [Alicyclobacillaceae bacterium]|nr:S41 family peptidase [Alicyclobacillaceae bacterium]